MAVAMRTNNYFELRNREMGFYTELRTAIILARINVDRTALRLFRERASAIRRALTTVEKTKSSCRFMHVRFFQTFPLSRNHHVQLYLRYMYTFASCKSSLPS